MELDAWDEADWESRVRQLLSAVPGWCVLDLREDNILSYQQGDWAYVERDIKTAFAPPALAEAVLGSFRDEVQTCLAVRRELINFKKLCLHVWQAGSAVEKDLRQLASFFFCEVVETPGRDSAQELRRRRYVEISEGLNQCRGAVVALHDVRHFSKAICALPRHPESGAPWKFEALPESLEVWKPLEEAKYFIQNHQALDAFFASRWGDGPAEVEQATPAGGYGGSTPDEGTEARSASTAPLRPPAKPARHWKSEREFVSSALGPEGLKKLLSSVEASGIKLPASAARYVELVLVARGASKALALRSALLRYIAALRQVTAEAEEVEQQLLVLLGTSEALPPDKEEQRELRPLNGTAHSAGLHLHCTRHLLVLKGMVPVLSEMLRWLEPIADMRSDAGRLFVSGSRGAAAFVPRGFPDLLARHRAALASGGHREAMLAELAPGGPGWPRSALPKPEEGKRVQPCSNCKACLTRLWLHRGLCLLCETELRCQGRCPYGGERCGSRSFCPHEHRCIVCEQWSCERCRLLRGDGEDVWQLVDQRQPTVVFLDFDRTLCTTKAGASPLQGNHSLDSDLVAVCSCHARVLVVTRSSRSEDIALFLRQHGLNACIPGHKASSNAVGDASNLRGNVSVRSVKREGRQSKAEVILEELAATPAATGLFVDDDIKELIDPSLAPLVDKELLLRLLFVRSGGKE
eukprot:TRINITY_DN82840_c0_g1_i1.p1 TRINITY_DN82840_c0_g1~~TRINITY_DN82840_c0_g1_i1.p1  ORF type:complete len:694 (+),score=148.12 TRINITY_DN82840_c0_g1_i1:34-2115(+)